jgi:branched-chain amino acid transport system permease protein
MGASDSSVAKPDATTGAGAKRAAGRGRRPGWLRLEVVILPLLLLYPFFPVLDQLVQSVFDISLRLDRQLVNIFIFAILALALNLQVGYAGLLQLGIAAFFAIGAFSTGILTVGKYPFQIGFWGALVAAPALAGTAGLALGAPTIRLRGDYLAIVTLGFGEVTRVVLLNLDNITDGSRGLNPIRPRGCRWLTGGGRRRDRADALPDHVLRGARPARRTGDRLPHARAHPPGREFVALREDGWSPRCMGINPARTKLIAFAAARRSPGWPARCTRPTSPPPPSRTRATSPTRSWCCAA